MFILMLMEASGIRFFKFLKTAEAGLQVLIRGTVYIRDTFKGEIAI